MEETTMERIENDEITENDEFYLVPKAAYTIEEEPEKKGPDITVPGIIVGAAATGTVLLLGKGIGWVIRKFSKPKKSKAVAEEPEEKKSNLKVIDENDNEVEPEGTE